MKKKLRARSGETLIETVIGVLLIALVFLIIADAVMAAGKINTSVRNDDMSFSAGEAIANNYNVSIRRGGTEIYSSAADADRAAVLYGTENGYYYYDCKTVGGAP